MFFQPEVYVQPYGCFSEPSPSPGVGDWPLPSFSGPSIHVWNSHVQALQIHLISMDVTSDRNRVTLIYSEYLGCHVVYKTPWHKSRSSCINHRNHLSAWSTATCKTFSSGSNRIPNSTDLVSFDFRVGFFKIISSPQKLNKHPLNGPKYVSVQYICKILPITYETTWDQWGFNFVFQKNGEWILCDKTWPTPLVMIPNSHWRSLKYFPVAPFFSITVVTFYWLHGRLPPFTTTSRYPEATAGRSWASPPVVPCGALARAQLLAAGSGERNKEPTWTNHR